MKAVIAGATGLVGSFVLQKLLDNPQVSEVIALTRRTLSLQSPKLKPVLIKDFSQMANMQSQLKGDIYFCCLGTTIKEAGSQENFRKIDFDAIVEFAKVAKANEAQSFVLISAVGANAESPIFYNRVKGETEEALKALHFRSLIVFQPGLLIGNRTKLRIGEKLAISAFKLLSPLLPGRFEKMFATDVELLANRIVEASLASQSGLQIISSRDI